jgi:hypothetical protein
MIMDRGDKDIKIDVIMWHDDELIRIESDQFLEDKNELDFE